MKPNRCISVKWFCHRAETATCSAPKVTVPLNSHALTVHPYFNAIPCNVSVCCRLWRIRNSLFRTWLQVLPYFFNCRAESRIDCRSFNKLSLSIVTSATNAPHIYQSPFKIISEPQDDVGSAIVGANCSSKRGQKLNVQPKRERNTEQNTVTRHSICSWFVAKISTHSIGRVVFWLDYRQIIQAIQLITSFVELWIFHISPPVSINTGHWLNGASESNRLIGKMPLSKGCVK